MTICRRLSAVACCLALSLTAVAQDTAKLTIQTDGDRQAVNLGGELFTAYNHKDAAKPFLYPIIGPTGANMTRHYPMKKGVEGESKDHPHHTSMWFTHGGVSGVDFWHEGKNRGTIATQVVSPTIAEGRRVMLASIENWLTPKKAVLATATNFYGFEALEDGSRVIDYATTLAPDGSVGELVFADTKEGTMGFRLAPQLRLKGGVATGQAVNSEGDKDKNTWGKRAKWVAYWGVIDGNTCGVAIFDHPTNLRHPTWWHARDYGLVAANPFGMSDFERGKYKRGDGEFVLKHNERLEMLYRFVFFAGTPQDADIAGKYDQWIQETTEKE
ncbi:MAG: PmoA family protein [Phycisphaeraceae bacterium]